MTKVERGREKEREEEKERKEKKRKKERERERERERKKNAFRKEKNGQQSASYEKENVLSWRCTSLSHDSITFAIFKTGSFGLESELKVGTVGI